MYLGNELKCSSHRLSYCLFESDWIGQSQLCQKSIIILAEALKQLHELIIGKIYPLNLKTFSTASYELVNLTLSNNNLLIDFKRRLQHVQYIENLKLNLN